jgi:gamma-glutamyltranspeptidase / glutathione hydrolase
MMQKSLCALLLLFIVFSCQQRSVPDMPNRKGLVTENAMVVSAHPLASRIGNDILAAGGNAIDATVAVHFALAVVYPAAGNIGGGGFVVYRSAKGECHTLDYREKAPAAAERDMYLDDSGEADAEKSIYGHLASGVPGSVDGMVTIHRKFGSMPWEVLLQPAIRLANEGFLLTEKEAAGLNHNRENLMKYNTIPPGFLIMEQWEAGDTVINYDLGNTLQRIAEQGRAGFYEGETARLIVEEMQRGGGLITYEDLMNYQSVWRDPLIFQYKNYRVISMPPPSSGGVALLQLLKMVEQYPLGDWGPYHENTVHLMAEAGKLVLR